MLMLNGTISTIFAGPKAQEHQEMDNSSRILRGQEKDIKDKVNANID